MPVKAELREAASPDDMASAKAVRSRVFVQEQNVPVDIEMDEYDDKAVHVVCILAGEVVGTGRLVRMPDGMKLGRVAVLPEHRSKGLGTGIVVWLIRKSLENGFTEVYANVQLSAMPFYEGLGFEPAGEIFLEAGIKHIRMTCKGNCAQE